jgi:hypothetical protein
MTERNAITAGYTWTPEELIAAHENNARAVCRRPYRVGLVFLALMAILAGWGYYSSRGWGIPSVLFPLGGVYILFLRKFDKRAAIRRHFKRRPDRNTEIVWTMTSDDFHIKTHETDYHSKWSQIASVRRARNGFLLYPNETMFYWIPFHALPDEQREAAETLLREKVQDFKDIT